MVINNVLIFLAGDVYCLESRENWTLNIPSYLKELS